MKSSADLLIRFDDDEYYPSPILPVHNNKKKQEEEQPSVSSPKFGEYSLPANKLKDYEVRQQSQRKFVPLGKIEKVKSRANSYKLYPTTDHKNVAVRCCYILLFTTGQAKGNLYSLQELLLAKQHPPLDNRHHRLKHLLLGDYKILKGMYQQFMNIWFIEKGPCLLKLISRYPIIDELICVVIRIVAASLGYLKAKDLNYEPEMEQLQMVLGKQLVFPTDEQSSQLSSSYFSRHSLQLNASLNKETGNFTQYVEIDMMSEEVETWRKLLQNNEKERQEAKKERRSSSEQEDQKEISMEELRLESFGKTAGPLFECKKVEEPGVRVRVRNPPLQDLKSNIFFGMIEPS